MIRSLPKSHCVDATSLESLARLYNLYAKCDVDQTDWLKSQNGPFITVEIENLKRRNKIIKVC